MPGTHGNGGFMESARGWFREVKQSLRSRSRDRRARPPTLIPASMSPSLSGTSLSSQQPTSTGTDAAKAPARIPAVGTIIGDPPGTTLPIAPSLVAGAAATAVTTATLPIVTYSPPQTLSITVTPPLVGTVSSTQVVPVTAPPQATTPSLPQAIPRTATPPPAGTLNLVQATPATAATPPAATPPPTQIVAATTPSSCQSTLSLWEQAVEKLRSEGGDLDCGVQKDIQLVTDLIEEVKRKKDECDQKRWFYIEDGEKVFFVDKCLGQLNKYALLGDIALQHHPDIVALAWSGFRLLLQVGTAYIGHMRIVSESLEYIVKLLCCCDIYEKLYSKENLNSTGLLNTSIVNLYASILVYLYYAKQYLEKHTGARVVESFFSDLEQLLGNIRVGEKEVSDKAGMTEKEAASTGRSDHGKRMEELRNQLTEIQKPVQNIQSTLEAVYKDIKGDRHLKILNWLSTVQYDDHHSFTSERRQRDTGHWLLENTDYLKWKELNSSSLFWLRGDAGSGKTMLASMMIDEYKKDRDCHALAFFYCYYQDQDRGDPANILRGLVKQICVAYPEKTLPTPLLSIYEEREQKAHSSGPLKLNESVDLIIKLSEGFWQTTIIIDALDECNSKTRRSLFVALRKIVNATSQVKIFVTGRNDGDIQDILLHDFPSHYMHEVDNTHDINKYIDTEVERRCNPMNMLDDEKPLLNGNIKPDLKEKVVSTLKSKAHGMFMWAHFQIVAICEEHTAGDIEEVLNKLPNDLNTTYKQVFERIDSQSEAARSTARKVLKWILYAEDTSPETIIQAFAVKSGEATLDEKKLEWTMRDILRVCHNLVVYDEKLKNLRFAHLSVQEFLQKFLQDEAEFVQKEQAHTHMAEICLTVLINHHSGTQASRVPALLQYATSHWAHHVRLSGTGGRDLEGLWKEFLTPGLAYNTWGSRITKTEDDFLAQDDQIVPPLWTACYYQLYDISRFLLDSDADPNPCNKHGSTPLLSAAGNGHKEIVQMLLEKEGIEINSPDDDGYTPLLSAAGNGHKEIVQMLLEKEGIEINSPDDNTPLFSAVWDGHKEIVQILLEKEGIDINSPDFEGYRPLERAASEGHKEIVQMLLEKEGIKINSIGLMGYTPLERAASKGHKEIVQMLLEKEGIEIGSKNIHGHIPLLLAAWKGHKEIVQMLLEKEGIEINSTDDDGNTPLSSAVRNGHEEIVQMLLEKEGIEINSIDNDGDTPLSSAVRNGHEEIVQMLLEKEGIEINFIDSDGDTPLSSAVRNGHEEIVQMLLEKEGIKINSIDSDGDTPLSLAAWNGHKEIVQMLLEVEGVDINYRESNGYTPLELAVFDGYNEIVQMLLEKDEIDTRCVDDDGDTPLAAAAWNGYKKTVQILLERGGMDINYKNKNGKTALVLARSEGYMDIVQLLLENGAQEDIDT